MPCLLTCECEKAKDKSVIVSVLLCPAVIVSTSVLETPMAGGALLLKVPLSTSFSSRSQI